jgi:hypothetical protein
MVSEVAAKQNHMESLLEMIRAGFLDLCEAVRADVHELRSEVDDRFRRHEVHLMDAVRKAISQERRYHELLERERNDAITTQHLDTRVQERVGSMQDSVAASIAHVERQLRALELRVVSNEDAVDSTRYKATLRQSEGHHGDAADADEQQRLLRGEMGHIASHVHSITHAHQQLIQTLVNERCGSLERQLRGEIDKIQVVLAELRQRVGSVAREQREHVFEVCNRVNPEMQAAPSQ